MLIDLLKLLKPKIILIDSQQYLETVKIASKAVDDECYNPIVYIKNYQGEEALNMQAVLSSGREIDISEAGKVINYIRLSKRLERSNYL